MHIEDSRLSKVMRPNPVEPDYRITQIEGEIPRELNGTLYRNCPNQKIEPKAGVNALHLFDGDGFVNAIRFEDGKAHFRGRYARTESFLREQEEGDFCLGTINVAPDRVLSDPPPNYQANTSAVVHGGRLWAMQETMPPFFMDPVTLESKELWDYDGKMLGMASSAHPCIDTKSGQMYQCGYQAMAPYLQLYCVESDGSVSMAEAHDTPWAGKVHDIAITENYIVIPLGALEVSTLKADKNTPLAALQALRARPDNMMFGIRKREPGSPIRWFETSSNHYIFHVGNAFERDGKIIMDACTFVDPASAIDNVAHMRDGRVNLGSASHPFLYEFDLEAGTCKETQLSDTLAEFPRFDDRRMGYESNYGYASVNGFHSIMKYSRTGGEAVTQQAIEGHMVGEPIFVPRTQDAAEDDGFVMTLRYDSINDRTGLDILDARGIDQEPLARLWLDQRIPFSPHGSWCEADSPALTAS
jgi:all-trans-8'-apo-beta-carotenal 15,15'-oxygenase